MDADPRMTGHVKRLWPELDDLFVTGELVQELVSHPGWAAVKRVLEAEAAEVGAGMNRTREPLSQADYALKHGRLDGLSAAVEAAQAILAIFERRMTEQRDKFERDAEPSLRS